MSPLPDEEPGFGTAAMLLEATPLVSTGLFEIESVVPLKSYDS